jgi:hypothetical protein
MMFSENKKEYYLEVSQLLSPEEIQTGLWLVMAGVDDIPPHIALINEGLYYSVSAKKVEVGVPIANFLKAISRKSVPTVFVKIKAPLSPPIRRIFERYPTLGNGEHSCLWPVRDVFVEMFSQKYSNATLVFELLAMAEQDGVIEECKSLFVEKGGTVILPKYTREQIREKINSILKVNE